jgi:cell division protein FtsI (penicillin-binding protein 3)
MRSPRLIDRIGATPTPAPRGRRVISQRTAAQLRRMLEGVVEAGGTGASAAIDGYSLAGKTGTAQKVDPATGLYSKTRYIASFVGFAPARDPKLLVTVMVDEPNGAIYGAQVAAPAFQEIMRFALPYLGIPSDR